MAKRMTKQGSLFGRVMRRLALALGLTLAGVVAGLLFAPLATFNAIMPKDGASRFVTSAAYGSDPRQQLDIYAPAAPATGKRAVIVFFYGGSWNSGDRGGYAFVGRALAARGFVVVVPDYRLVPHVRYPAFVQDGAAALDWTFAHIDRWGGDPARVVVMGHSAGAYNAAMLALDPRWLGAARHRLRGLIGLAGPYDFLPLTSPATQAAFGAAPDLAATQPVTYAGAGAPPALLATARDDTTVRARNSEHLAQRLTMHGSRAIRVDYPGIGHIGLITAIALPLRWRAGVLDDVDRFARDVTR